MNAAPAPAAPPAVWRRKDLLTIQELDAGEITLLLDTAQQFKEVGARDIKKVPVLRGRTLVNFFVEPSTRTRTSFELAAMRLSADVVNISASSSSLVKGETLKDTALVFQANNVDLIVHPARLGGSRRSSSRNGCDSSIINAGDGAHEHPTQALLDLFTIREKRGRIAGLHVAIVGDILFSRVARSNIWGLLKLGARVTLVGPTTLVPRVFERMGVSVARRIDDVLETVDVINLLRIQHERQRRAYFPGLGEYIVAFRPDPRTGRPSASRTASSCIPGRSTAAWRSTATWPTIPRHSVILDQVTNGLAVRMAALYLCDSAAPATRHERRTLQDDDHPRRARHRPGQRRR